MLLRENQAILGTALVFGTDAGFAWIGVIFGSLASSSLTFRCSLGREMRDGFIGPLSHAEAKSVCDPNQIASYKISTESDGFRCRSEWPTALQFRHNTTRNQIGRNFRSSNRAFSLFLLCSIDGG